MDSIFVQERTVWEEEHKQYSTDLMLLLMKAGVTHCLHIQLTHEKVSSTL